MELSDLRSQAVALGSTLRAREKEVEKLHKAVEEGGAELRDATESRAAAERRAKQCEMEAATARAKVRVPCPTATGL